MYATAPLSCLVHGSFPIFQWAVEEHTTQTWVVVPDPHIKIKSTLLKQKYCQNNRSILCSYVPSSVCVDISCIPHLVRSKHWTLPSTHRYTTQQASTTAIRSWRSPSASSKSMRRSWCSWQPATSALRRNSLSTWWKAPFFGGSLLATWIPTRLASRFYASWLRCEFKAMPPMLLPTHWDLDFQQSAHITSLINFSSTWLCQQADKQENCNHTVSQ